MVYDFIGPQTTFCFLDDLNLVSAGSESEHPYQVPKCLEKTDDGNLRIKFLKCHFAKQKLNGLDTNSLKLEFCLLNPKLEPF